MSVAHPRTAGLRDPGLPALEVLLTDGVPPPLQAAVEPAGTRVTEATAVQVTWWPARSGTVRYRARLAADPGRERQMVAVTGRIPEGCLVVEGEEGRVGVWMVPHDPALPGLAPALDPRAVRRLLGELGVPGGEVETRLRAYRPGRRAVVEARGETATIYLKVVPPREVEGLHRTHVALAEALPVPRSHGYSSELGMVVLQALPGTTLRRALEDPGAALPPAPELDALLRSLPTLAGASPVRSPIERMRPVAELLHRLVPEEGERIDRLLAAVGRDPRPPETPSHGDFYEAQLLVSAGRVVGLLDVDTYGEGRVADDRATMLGHLSVWRSSSRHPRRVAEYGSRLLALWDRAVERVDLRHRTGAVVLGLAVGPFRVQRGDWPASTRARLRLAERWVESAARVGGAGGGFEG